MPVLSIANEDAKQRLGNAVGQIPLKAVTVEDVRTREQRVYHVEPAWASFYWALMAGHETVLMTDAETVAEFTAWLDEHASGTVLFEPVVGS